MAQLTTDILLFETAVDWWYKKQFLYIFEPFKKNPIDFSQIASLRPCSIFSKAPARSSNNADRQLQAGFSFRLQREPLQRHEIGYKFIPANISKITSS